MDKCTECQMQLWTFIDGRIYLEENPTRRAEGLAQQDVQRWSDIFKMLVHEPDFPKYL